MITAPKQIVQTLWARHLNAALQYNTNAAALSAQNFFKIKKGKHKNKQQ